jgi:hypothetical protein
MKPILLRVIRAVSLCVLPLITVQLAGAQMVWTDISTQQGLPVGVKLFSGQQTSPGLIAYYAEIDLKNKNFVVHPYFSQPMRTTSAIAALKGALVAVNGGYFSADASVSAILEPNSLKARNIAALTRDGKSFPVTRSFLAINKDFTVSVDWIYHFSNEIADIVKFANPTANTTTTPAPVPVRANGTAYDNLLMGLGGGPTLIKNGAVRITHDEEVFFGSGIDWTTPRPRTAVGYTADGKLLMFVAEGGRVESPGATLQTVAQLMLSIGAVEAMNLDGGGSTTMAVKGALFNRPNGGTFQRSVPTILAVVPADSLKLPDSDLQGVILDTEMQEVVFSNNGDGWGTTANAGFYGSSPARISLIGDGSNFVDYRPKLDAAEYEVYGWWVSSFNRAPNTPYTVTHAGGQTMVRVNQQQNNASWVSLGKFTFTGTAADNVRISNDAATSSAGSQTYVVADAVRFVKRGTATSDDDERILPHAMHLEQNYPNPFNPFTMIEFTLAESQHVKLQVFDAIGRRVSDVVSGIMPAGIHRVSFDASRLSSGRYMYRLSTPSGVQSRVMTVVK